MTDLLARLQSALAVSYAVDREIGRGGMATVFLAEDLKHGRKVAIKVLHPELAASVGGERFLREIEIAAGLEHPHILSLIDSGQAGGLFYYVMPYVDGESLHDRLKREQQLPIEEAIRIAREIADGLGHARRHDVIHRDIKPANIMLSEGHALIADFGIARAVGAEGQGLTSTGLAVGTPAYMSPEQATGTDRVDTRSDQYSLGCVLYEMLAGEPPLVGPTPQSTATLRLTTTATSLPLLRETVPGGLTQVVNRTLAKSPADRYATPEELSEALAAPEVWEETKPKRKVGRRILAAIATILLLGAGSLLAQLFAGHGGPAVETDPNLIAVLPLVPAEAGDTALAQAVAARIRADLDGIGSIRTVDDATIRANESAFTGSLEDAAEWARSETGAGRLIQGSLTRIGDNEVGVELALYDSDGAMVARATGSGPPADPWVLADSLAWKLLDQIWVLGAAGARNYYYPILLRGRPFTAAREYLLADRLFWDELSFQQAAQAYERAFRADTTLWMASYVNDRLTRPGQFYDPGPRDSVVVSAWRDHVDDLPPAYQSWVEAWSVPFGSEASLARLQELRRPSATVPRGNFGPVLYMLADHLVHGGMRFGYSADYTIDVMEDAVAAGFGAELLDPTHLILAALGRDAPATRLWLDWRAADGVPDWTDERYRLIELVVGHLEDGADSALVDSVVADWDLSRSLDAPNPFWTRLRHAGVPDLAIDIHRRVSSREMEREQRISLHFQAALAWADRGAWDSAQVGLRRLSGEACDECDGIAFTLSAVGEWLGGLSPGSADEFRPGTVAYVARWGDDCFDCTVWLASVDGMIAAGRKDLTMLRDALHRVDSATAADQRLGPIGSYVARSLRATESALLGDRAGAADSLYALVWQQHYPPWGWRGYGHVHAFNRLAAARWLRAEGDWARARAIVLELQLPWRGGHRWADDHQLVLVATGPAYLELARIEEFRGRDAIARDYYQQFLQRYDMPVEAHRPLVEEARAGYLRLGGGPGEFE